MHVGGVNAYDRLDVGGVEGCTIAGMEVSIVMAGRRDCVSRWRPEPSGVVVDVGGVLVNVGGVEG